ncbi:MAG: ABC transporter substrate-binding protein, partial [Thermoplasmata archaeon]
MRALKRMAAATFLLVALLALSLGSVAIRGQVDELTGLFGGDLRVAVLEAVDLDPLTATSDASWKAISVAYDSLARVAPGSLLPEPWAAAGWTVNAAASTITVDLRSDLMWHDGTSVSASEIAAAYEAYNASGMFVPSDMVVTTPSATQLVFELPSGAGAFLTDGLTLPFFKTVGAAKVGSGAFVPPATVAMPLTLDRNDGHFSVPKLSTITYSLHADTGAASVALIRGDVDFIGSLLTATDPTRIITVDGRNTSLLNESDRITVVTNPGLSQFFLGFDTTDPILGEAVLRQAIAHVLNKELFLQIHPSVVGTSSLVASANLAWFNTSVPQYDAGFTLVAGRSTVNVAQSNSILDLAGYLDADGDGWRDTPAG